MPKARRAGDHAAVDHAAMNDAAFHHTAVDATILVALGVFKTVEFHLNPEERLHAKSLVPTPFESATGDGRHQGGCERGQSDS